jgi:tetratricopeptide (TPR) repeat protein
MPRPQMPCLRGRTLAIALLAVPLAQAQDDGGAARDAQQVFARVSASVVTVQALDAQGQADGQGSGVVVAPGLVATNCHVVRSAATLQVTGTAGKQAAQWTHQLAGLDLCLLAAPGLSTPPVVLRPSQELAVGEPVYAVGNPLGFGLAVSSGLLSSRQAGEPHARLAATAPVSPGSSGGGLFDRQARLLGLTTAILGTGQSLNLVLPAEAVAALLAQAEPRAPAQAVPPAEPRWAAVAVGLYDRQDWAGLQAHAQAWLQAQPRSAPALVYLARAAGQQQDHAQAEALARRALALDGDLASAWSELAQALIATGRSAEGEQALQQAALRQPGEADPHIVRSFLRKSQGQPEAAREEMRSAVRKRPFSPRLWTELGRQEAALGQADAAQQAFAAAVRLGGAPPVAGTAPSATLDIARQTEALEALGWIALRQQRYVQAEEAFRKGLALDGEHAGLWNGIGGVMQGTLRWAEAEQAFTRSLAREANDALVLANRGDVLRVQRQFERAMADAQAALRLKPDEPVAQRLLAVLLLDMRRFADAAPAYARLSALQAPNDDDLVNWAESLVNIGQAQEALAKLKQAEAGQPGRLRFNLVMGRTLGAQNDVAGALAYLERALADNPSASVVWSSKGYALMRLDRLAEAIASLETAVRLDPTLSNGWINLGHAQMRARNLGRAIEALEKAVVLAPEAMDGRFYLAQSYLQARMPAKAREHAQAVVARQPALPPALALMAVSYLAENNAIEAGTWHRRLHAAAPEIAGKVRLQAIGAGMAAAQQWPQ